LHVSVLEERPKFIRIEAFSQSDFQFDWEKDGQLNQTSIMKEINQQTTIRGIDNLFITTDDDTLKISLKKSHEYQPIELITIIHFLLTHLQSKSKFELLTNIKTEELELVQKQFYDYYILVCCLLFKRNLTIRNSENNFLYTEDLYKKIIEKLKSQDELYARELNSNHIKELKTRFFSKSNKLKNSEGLSFVIPCFDHLADISLDRSNYFHNSLRPKGPKDIAVWFERLFSFNDIKISLPHMFYDLSIVINELMQNTFDWARTTYDDEDFIKPNIRACAVNIFLQDKIKLKDSSYDYIQDYLKQIFTTEKSKIRSTNGEIELDLENEKIAICEISILDTGPGMARRWLKRDYNNISFEDEGIAVIECFHKYFTSDRSSRSQLRGRGLSNVINIIGRSGFIRVRTGHVLIQRNFFKNNIQQEELQNSNLVFDHTNNNLPKINGTTISILYPFIYAQLP